MRTVLVTGMAGPAADVTDALRARGIRAVRVPAGAPLAAACASIPARTLAGYVQLPVEATPGGPGAPAREVPPDEVRALIAGGLLARFEGFSTVAPLLASDAVVVLVPGDAAGDTLAGHPDRVRVLTRLLLDRNGAGSVGLAVAGAGWSAEDIAEFADTTAAAARARAG